MYPHQSFKSSSRITHMFTHKHMHTHTLSLNDLCSPLQFLNHLDHALDPLTNEMVYPHPGDLLQVHWGATGESAAEPEMACQKHSSMKKNLLIIN